MEERKEMLTQEGYDKLLAELDERKTTIQAEIEEKLRVARSYGDLSENAEYDAAKDEQRDIEARIEELEKLLKNVEVVDEDEIDLEKVNIGNRVKLYDVEYEEEVEYQIVGSTEADSLKGKISNESPMGIALIGKKVGDTVDVVVGDETFQYKILDVNH